MIIKKIKNLIKGRYPKYFEKLRESQLLNNMISYYSLSKMIIKKPKMRKHYPCFLYHTFCHYVLYIRKDVNIKFKGNKIIIPNNYKGFDGFIEVWEDSFYDKIMGYNAVLDLGGYIGDSALKFALNNKHVDVFEAHPENYKYLLKNTTHLKNIDAYNLAVIGDDKKEIAFYGGGLNMASDIGIFSSKRLAINVKTKNIIDVLKSKNYDALKMDIEGAEYECLDAIIQEKENGFFGFKTGFIEFHLGDEYSKNIKRVQKYSSWFKNRGYSLDFFDVIKGAYAQELSEIKSSVFLLYFY